MMIIEVDPRVQGNCDEIPFPQAKQNSPELYSPSCQSSVCSFTILLCLQEKPTALQGINFTDSFDLFFFKKKLISNSWGELEASQFILID